MRLLRWSNKWRRWLGAWARSYKEPRSFNPTGMPNTVAYIENTLEARQFLSDQDKLFARINDETSPVHFAIMYEQEAAKELITFIRQRSTDIIHAYVVADQAAWSPTASGAFWAFYDALDPLEIDSAVLGLRDMAKAMRREAELL